MGTALFVVVDARVAVVVTGGFVGEFELFCHCFCFLQIILLPTNINLTHSIPILIIRFKFLLFKILHIFISYG